MSGGNFEKPLTIAVVGIVAVLTTGGAWAMWSGVHLLSADRTTAGALYCALGGVLLLPIGALIGAIMWSTIRYVITAAGRVER